MAIKIDVIPEGLFPKPYNFGNRMSDDMKKFLSSIVNLGAGKCVRVKFPNKKEMKKHQTAAQKCTRVKGRKTYADEYMLPEGFYVATRSEPVSSEDGEYLLFVRVLSRE